MSDLLINPGPCLAPLCGCDRPERYPFDCPCLGLRILSPEMHTIARGEPLQIAGQSRPYDRSALVDAWRDSQEATKKRQRSDTHRQEPPVGCCGPLQRVRRTVRGAVGLMQATAGINAAAPDTVRDRYTTCSTCPENDCGQCRLCGCWIAPKIRISGERCPTSRW